MFTVNKNPTRDDLRKFGVAMLIGFSLLATVYYCWSFLWSWDLRTLEWTGAGRQIAAVSLPALGVFLFLLSRVSLGATKLVYVTWMSIMVPIGIVMSTIMLILLYIVLLPVFSIIVRWNDPLRKKLIADGSYWEDYKPHEATLERMQRPF